MNKNKILVIILIVISLLVVGGLSYIGNYFYNLALNPNTSKDIIFGSEEEEEETSGEVLDEDINWLLNESNYSDKYLTSFDGLKLHSY
ncbi:MAG: alpha/beta hydrolase, partial [Peptostreptococcaceae bacterium]